MSGEAALMTLARQLEADVGPWVRLAVARGEAIAISLYVDEKGRVCPAQVKAKPGKPSE